MSSPGRGSAQESSEAGAASQASLSAEGKAEVKGQTQPRAAVANAAADTAPAAVVAKNDSAQSVSPASDASVAAPAATVIAPPPATPAKSVNTVVTTVTDVSNSSTGDHPQAPTDPPAESILAAAARRELSVAAATDSPDVALTDGVIGGCVITSCPQASHGLPLNYVVVSGPNLGGKVIVAKTDGRFSYLPDISVLDSGATEQFAVLVSETTPFVTALESVPVFGLLVQPLLMRVYQVPLVSDLLAPLIGDAEVHRINVDVGEEVPAGAPVAFTQMVVSFDGTLISTNFFPASGLAPGDSAPTLLNGPSLATAGYIDPSQQTTVFGLEPGLKPLRAAGYNVVTWDPRGEFASGGVLQLDNPDFEGRDVQAIITWLTRSAQTRSLIEYDPGDLSQTNPLLGMVGGSYGGGIQLAVASIDPRVDAISPGIAWHTLPGSLYPNEAFKTSFASLLLLSLVASGSRINPEIYAGILTGAALGVLTPGQLEFLDRSSADVANISVPTLFVQGTVDVLFPLQQAIDNAAAINPDVPVKMIWYCGGHGQCLDPGVDQEGQTLFLTEQIIDWMNQYVMNKGIDPPPPVTGPKFVWIDQDGDYYSSSVLPFDPEFVGTPIDVTGGGGTLLLTPVLGGSGPQDKATFPVSLALGSKADYPINIPVPNPGVTEPVQIVGAPQLTFDYRGLGTNGHVYAQLVDNDTGRVLGNIVSSIPVTLDGLAHQVTVPISMENVAYTMGPDSKGLTLQIVGTATPFENFTSYGAINVSNVELSLPTANPLVVTPGKPSLSAVAAG